MLTRWRRLTPTVTAVGAVLAALIVAWTPAAWADTDCQIVNDQGICLIGITRPGRPGGPGTPGHPGVPGGSGGSEGTPWHDPCSYSLLTPQPPAGDPKWEGHTPDQGLVWLRTCPPPDGSQVGGGTPWNWFTTYFVPKGGDPVQVAPPDPAVLAQQAVSQMVMLRPTIRMAPPPGSAGAVVGVPVWMWIERDPSTTGPITKSASAGGITVTATASVARIEWQMGEGTTVTCATPGTPFDAARAQQGSPDCGYVYQHRSSPDRTGGSGQYTITATSVWQIHWEGGGKQGDQTLRLPSTATLIVGELQSVNRDSGGNP